LQSGAAVGAILIPFVMFWLFDEERIETWRLPFFVVGAGGALWVVAWWASVRPSDLSLAHQQSPLADKLVGPTRSPATFVRRYAVLVVLVVTINMTWHFLRAWGPLFLQQKHGFTSKETFQFSIGYYIFTDLGALTAGFITLRLARGGLAVHSSRTIVFLSCAVLTGLCALVPFLSSSIVLLVIMMAVGFGALGVFPNYYSFSQDLTIRHQGKLTGTLGCFCWIAMAIWQKAIGWTVETTGSYTIPFLISGAAPLIGFFVLYFFWGEGEEKPVAPPLQPHTQVATTAETRITTPPESVQPGTS
jgi:ACS family hexuronate transporter-like MFS transporter